MSDVCDNRRKALILLYDTAKGINSSIFALKEFLSSTSNEVSKARKIAIDTDRLIRNLQVKQMKECAKI